MRPRPLLVLLEAVVSHALLSPKACVGRAHALLRCSLCTAIVHQNFDPLTPRGMVVRSYDIVAVWKVG